VNPDIRIQGFDEQKFAFKFFSSFLLKIAVFLSPGLLKGSPSYRRNLQPSKKNIQHSKRWKFLNHFLFFWVIFALREPDPGLIQNHNTDYKV
jgi:hypothetical protein